MADTETSIERIMKNLQVKGHILGIAVGQGKGQSLAPPNKIIAAKQGWSAKAFEEHLSSSTVHAMAWLIP